MVLSFMTSLPISLSADDMGEPANVLSEDVPFIYENPGAQFELLPGDLSPEELQSAVLSPSEIPVAISQAQINELQHVNRLYEQEPDAYTVVFQNRDAGKTVYIFDKPVKKLWQTGSMLTCLRQK